MICPLLVLSDFVTKREVYVLFGYKICLDFWKNTLIKLLFLNT
jgi:hypothetical protein